MPEIDPRILAAGYRTRPATNADAEAIAALIAADEIALHGRADTGVDDVAAGLTRAGLDPTRDTLLVLDADGALAARAWINRGRRAEIDVHPAHRDRGLGSTLLTWVEQRAREVGSTSLSQIVSDADTAGTAQMKARGYRVIATQWLLEIAMPEEPTVPEPPSGVTVRTFAPGDEHAAYTVIQDAFDEYQTRRKDYDEWASIIIEKPTFAPSASPAAFLGDEMVGVVLSVDQPGSDEGYIAEVAVRADQRHRGIARMLLRHAFRASYARGQRVCTLWTHSDTGALSLYERVGMTVRRSSTVWNRPLD